MENQPAPAFSGEPLHDRLGLRSLELPGKLGHYELLSMVSRGGIGAVYRATHTRLKRPVAIKLLRPERAGDQGSIARFLQEMEAVGRLNHPNLVQAYDAGETDGRHFLAMELVVGADLRQLVVQLGPLRTPDACEAIRQAACGLQHAHEHGLVHRDVKPSNLMVSSDGTVKLLDLGLARFSDTESPSGNTRTDAILGSGDYLSPEQVEDSRQADARSDVYALGCTLYFLLAGHAPFEDTRHNTFGRKLLAHVSERVPDLLQRRPDLPKGLVELLDRMLAKQPSDRPATMAEVEQVLAGHIEGSDLSALVARFPEEDRPVSFPPTEADTPPRHGSDGTCQEPRSLPAAWQRPVAERLVRRLGPVLLAAGLGAVILTVLLALPRGHVETHTPEPLNPTALVQRPALLPDARAWTLETRGGRAPVEHLAVSSDDRLLAAADATGCVRVWRRATGDLLRIVIEQEPIRAVAWLPCGRQLAVAAGSLRIWDVQSGRLIWDARLAEADPATSLDCGPDGVLASGHRSGEIRLWEARTREVTKVWTGHRTSVTALRFSADGARLASGDEAPTICLWGLTEDAPLERFEDAEPGPIRRLAWSPDATRLASCGGGRHVTIWDQAEEFRPRRENAANQPVSDLGWSDDGRHFFAVSGGDGGVEFATLWDGAVRRQIHQPLMAPNAATALAWSRDAATVYCGSLTGEILIYLPDSAETKTLRPAAATRVIANAWSPDGSRLLLGDCAGYSRLWNAGSGEQLFAVNTGRHPVSVFAWQPGAERFATGHHDGRLAVVDASTGKVLKQISCEGHVLDAAFSPDGKWLATAEEHGACRIWNAATGNESFGFPVENRPVVNAVAWSPDGAYLAFSAWDGRLRVIDVAQQRVICDWDSGQGCVWWMLWEPDGNVLLTSGAHGGIAWWDALGGIRLRREEGCLREVARQRNALGSLQSFCASRGLRGISPDGSHAVQPLVGSTVGIRHTGTEQLQLVLCPMPHGHWLTVAPATGHYRADLAAAETPVYVVVTDAGQDNCTPAGFSARHGWSNTPRKVGFVQPVKGEIAIVSTIDP